MRKKLLILSLAIISVLVLASCSSSASEENTESSEATEQTDSDSQRIVATTVALVEMVEALDLDLVGVPTTYKDLSERYSDAREVGLAMEPDMEIIQSLKPTDVLSVTSLKDDVDEYFTKTDTPVTYIDLESIEGMLDSLWQLAENYDREDLAEEMIADYNDRLADIEEQIAGKEEPSVLILLGVPGSYLVATENSYLGDLVKRAGGKNVYADSDSDVEYTAVNTEYLQQTNPDIILRAAHGMPEEVVEMFDQEFAENDIWQHFKAVEDGKVYDLEETLFGTTANLAVIEALEHLVTLLHEDLE